MEGIIQGYPWLFDNQLLVLQLWSEGLSWKDDVFGRAPFWIQVWYIPPQWFFIDLKIGSMLRITRDVLLVEAGGKEDKHLKLQFELDLTTPLLRGLKFKRSECWVELRYEILPTFYFYCGHMGYNKKQCTKRKHDLTKNCLLKEQFGLWLRAVGWRSEGVGYKGKGLREEIQEKEGNTVQGSKRERVNKRIDLQNNQDGSIWASKEGGMEIIR